MPKSVVDNADAIQAYGAIISVVISLILPLIPLFFHRDNKSPAPADDTQKGTQQTLSSDTQYEETLLDTSIVIDKETCPYLGLTAFSQAESHLFFGRRREIREALGHIGRAVTGLPDSPPCYWLQVEGNSGAGKSSLVKAGLLPVFSDVKASQGLMQQTGMKNWKIIDPIMPGKHPLDRLANALEQSFINDPNQRDLGACKALLTNNEAALSDKLREQADGKTTFVLVIDQFEELFTLSDADERNQLDALLAYALKQDDCPLCLITTVRLDFLEGFEMLPKLSEMYNRYCKRYLLKTISLQGLREAIEKPAEQAGLEVSEVSAAILHDAQHEVGALPLVENALRVLWQHRKGNKLSGHFFTEKGGLAGLLEDQADALLASIEHKITGGKQASLELLLALTRVNDEGRHTRRRLPIGEACLIAGGKKANKQQGRDIIDYLTGRRAINPASNKAGQLRLLTTVGEADKQEIDIIHETLIRSRGDKDAKTGKLIGYWQTLYQYIEKNRDRGFYRDQLARKAKQWQANKGLKNRSKLAAWGDFKRYKNLRLEKDTLEYNYRRRSQWLLGLQALVIAVVLGFVVESFAWTQRHGFPTSYMLMQQQFRLMSWGVMSDESFMPENDLVKIPASAEPFKIGELNEDNRKNTDPSQLANFAMEPKEIQLKQAFELSKYELSYQQYDYYVWRQQKQGKPVDYPDGTKEKARGNRAVVNVSWDDANAYLQWLSDRTGDYYRLPSEAEWEYAARAGTTTSYWWGDEIGKNNASCYDCGSKWDNKTVAPVNSFEADKKWGLYNMAGNVWEWTCSEWGESFDGREMPNRCVDPKNNDGKRVIRGGSWNFRPVGLRSSSRTGSFTDFEFNTIGFRVLRDSRTN